MIPEGAVALNPSIACSYALMPEDLRIAMSMAMDSPSHRANRLRRTANPSTSLGARQDPVRRRLALRVMKLIDNRRGIFTPPVSLLSRLPGASRQAADHAQHMHDLPLTVSKNLPAPHEPTDGSIRRHRPMLKQHVLAALVQRFIQGLRHGLPVVRMDESKPVLPGARPRTIRQAEHGVHLPGPAELAGLTVPIPAADFCGCERVTKLSLMGPERIFGELSLRDIGRYPADRIRGPVLTAQRELDREVSMQPVLMRGLLFVFHRRILLEHLNVVRAKGIGDLAGENLVVRVPDNLIGCQVEEFLETAIHEEEASIRVLRVDDGGGRVGDFLKQLLASANRLFRPL